MKKLFLLGLMLLMPLAGRAVIYTAASPAYADVKAKTDVMITGDVLYVPAGLAVWTNRLQIVEKGISIIGAGGHPTNAANTILVDENPLRSSASLFDITWSETGTTNLFMLSGFEFRTSSNMLTANLIGMVSMRGSNFSTNNSAWRICSNYWHMGYQGANVNIRPATIRAWSGLVDHFFLDATGSAGFVVDCRINASEIGHRSWATPIYMGTTNEGVYFESGQMYKNIHRALFDGFAGARYVLRYITATNVTFASHGTESAGIVRGTRWIAAYNNDFHINVGQSGPCVHYRSGTGIVMSNVSSGTWPSLVSAVNDRNTDPFRPYWQSNGTNVWDQNDGVLYYSGTHTGTNGSAVLVDNTKSWAPLEFDLGGWEVQNLDQHYVDPTCNVTNIKSGLITANTATTITKSVSAVSAGTFTWNTGDHYRIYHVNRALDAFGQGQGDLLSGTGACTVPTPTGWPNQIDQPCMIFGNTGTAGNTFDSRHGPFIEGRNWTNVNNVSYVPLVYPHPLAGGVIPPPPATPSAPTNLTATAQSPTTILLGWTNTATNAVDIRIERSTTSGSGFVEIAAIAPDQTSYSSVGLTSSTTYYYRIRASNAGGFSSYTSQASATTQSTLQPAKLGHPSGIGLRKRGGFPQ